MSDLQSENSHESSSKIKTPSKRTPSKRLSQIEKAQLESAEMIKNMGGSLDVEGGRRTRSSVRGGGSNSTPTTPATPPPMKKSRQSSTTTPRRGRPKRIAVIDNDDMKNDDNSIDDDTKKIPEKINDDNDDKTKHDELTTGTKPDNEVTTETKSDTLDETPGTVNENTDSKKNDENILPITTTAVSSSTSNLQTDKIEKTEVDALETIHENHIEEQKTPVTPDVIVTAPTPEKQILSIKNNVPEIKLDPIEPMEVDSSMKCEENDTKLTNSLNIDEPTNTTTVTQSTSIPTNNCISLSTADNLMENNNKNDVQIIEASKIIKEDDNKSTTAAADVVGVESNNVVVVNDKTNDETIKIIPQNDNKINSIVENDKKNQTPSNDNKIVVQSDDKKENDSCEPKISSPPPSSDGITQPQTCN